jgi:hypothetical protein
MALPVRPKPKALTVDGFLISGYSETGEWIEEFVPGSYNPSQQTVKRFREVNSITSGPGSVLITPDFHLKERLGTFSLTSLPLDTPRRIIIS